jgi:hypothetical protein
MNATATITVTTGPADAAADAANTALLAEMAAEDADDAGADLDARFDDSDDAHAAAGDELEALNRALRAHKDFRPGMRFVAAPAGARGCGRRWYTWEPDPSVLHPFVEASAAVPAEFVLSVARRGRPVAA